MSAETPERPLRKWTLLAAFWATQAGVFYLGFGLLPQYHPAAQGRTTVYGLPVYGGSFDFDYLVDAQYVVVIAASLAVITCAQAVFLWPVRKPAPRARAGASLWMSMIVAGLAVALLVGGVLAAAIDIFILSGGPHPSDDWAIWAIGAMMLLSWGASTPFLLAFCTKYRRETGLQRLAARLFLGTLIETTAAIPLNAMVRRKTDCYCDTGTFWTLCATIAVGLFALGPAVLLPILARRRKRWYAGHCDACGYDMSGTPAAERCPECGTGWRP